MSWVQIAAVEELEVGQMKGLIVGYKKIALYHLEDGFYATSDVCSHSGRLLSPGTLYGQTVTCPAHGGKFNVKTGKAKAFPCVEPIKTYPLEIRNSDIWLKVT